VIPSVLVKQGEVSHWPAASGRRSVLLKEINGSCPYGSTENDCEGIKKETADHDGVLENRTGWVLCSAIGIKLMLVQALVIGR
jgi:hypothetical protein